VCDYKNVNKSFQHRTLACWTVFKLRFYGFAAQKYSIKPQLKSCRGRLAAELGVMQLILRENMNTKFFIVNTFLFCLSGCTAFKYVEPSGPNIATVNVVNKSAYKIQAMQS
jgi:hypothetical protein